jgi:hypothetical protein
MAAWHPHFFADGTSFGETEDFRSEKKTHFFLTIFGKNRSFGVAEWLFNKILRNFLRGFSQHFLTHKKSDLLGTRSRDSISKNIARMGQVGKP